MFPFPLFPVAEVTPQMCAEIDLSLARGNTNMSDFSLITLQKISVGPLGSLVIKSMAEQYLDQKSESIHVLTDKYLRSWDRL